MAHARWLAGILGVLLLLQAPIAAQASENAPEHNIDLSSSEKTISAGEAGSFSSVAISVGSGTHIVNSPSELLTPGEFVALSQVLTGGAQNIVLNDVGAATGGHFNTNGIAAASLALPSGVSAIHDFALASSLALSGGLSNAGSLYLVSSSSAVTSGIVSAASILNTGNISSVLPFSISQANNFASAVSFTLQSSSDIVNPGTISSSAALNLQAANAVINGATGSITAASNLSIMSSAGSIINSGLASAAGNLNIASAALGRDLLINNVGGLLQAGGLINIGDASLTDKINTVLFGGDLALSELNVFSGNGVVNINVHDLSGIVHVHAGEAHIAAETPNLYLGQICLSGDPTFYNAEGHVFISSPLVFSGANLAIVARGDILSAPGAGVIDTSSATGNGGDITLIAGANFTVGGGAIQSQPPTVDSTSTLTINGSSAYGGRIDLLSPAPLTVLRSNSTAANGNGGKITLVAFGGADLDSGRILLPQSLTISSGGSGSGKNGDVALYAGSPNAVSAISAGIINTTGGASNSGAIDVRTTQALASSLTIMNGAVTAGSIAPGFSSTPGSISVTNLISDGAPVTVTAGGTLLVNSISSAALTGGKGGAVSITSGSATPLTLGAVTANSVLSVDADAGATGDGGTITVTNTTGGVSVSSFAALSVSSPGGKTGSVSLNAGSGVLLLPDTTLRVSGTTGDAGDITLKANTITIASTGKINLEAAGAGSGNGGSIAIEQTSGNLSITPGSINILAQGGSAGSAAGNGGRLTVTAGGNTTIDPLAVSLNPLGNNGDGGKLTATAVNVAVSGSLALNGVGTGKGGDISLLSASATQFSVTNGAVANGVFGSLSVTGASGGTIVVVNSGSGGVRIYNPAAIAASGTNGNGGSIGAYGGLYDYGMLLFGTSPVRVDGGTLAANGGGNGNGGTISLGGTDVALPGGHVSFVANGSGTGNGGTITIEEESSGTTIGNAAAEISISAVSGAAGGNGGSLTVLADQSISVNPLGLDVAPKGANGNGGSRYYCRFRKFIG